MENKTSKKILQQMIPVFKHRLNTARPMLKCKTTAEIPRPVSSRGKDFYTLNRILPNIVKEDKELLFEENMRLKSQSNDLVEENHLLRTRVKQLENKKKKYEKKDPTLSLISNLKDQVKELNEKISEKEEENQILKRNLKTCKLEESEIQIKALEEECKRLSSHISEFMKQKDIPSSHLEYENKLYGKNKVIGKLKNDLKLAQEQIFQVKEENSGLKEKIGFLDRKNRKTSPKTNEINNLKERLESLQSEYNKIQTESAKKEENLKTDLRALTDHLDKETQKIKTLEKEKDEQQDKITQLERQVSFIKSETIRSQESIILKSLLPNEEKSKHPPRLFVKIWEVAKNKKMLISVFLSLLDKNNNGLIEAEELRKGISVHGKLIKRKHVDDVLKLMNNITSTFPISALEHLIEKYEYIEKYSSSSEEEVIVPAKPKVERLGYRDIKPDSRLNEPIVPQNYVPAKFKEPEVSLVRPELLDSVFERIRLQMIEKMTAKNRSVNLLFGNYLDPESLVSVKELKDFLMSGGVFLGNEEDVWNLSKFLIEPDGVEKMKESEYKGIKNRINDFSKKLFRYLPDWRMLDKYKQHLSSFTVLTNNKEEIYKEACDKNFRIKVEEFGEIYKRFGDLNSEVLTYFYLSSFLASNEVFWIQLDAMYQEIGNTQRKITDLAEKNKLYLMSVKHALGTSGLGFEEVFGYNKEILANFENFSSGIKSLEINLDEEFVNDIRFGKYNCHLGLFKALLDYLD